jgi:hypothetical protein
MHKIHCQASEKRMHLHHHTVFHILFGTVKAISKHMSDRQSIEFVVK